MRHLAGIARGLLELVQGYENLDARNRLGGCGLGNSVHHTTPSKTTHTPEWGGRRKSDRQARRRSRAAPEGPERREGKRGTRVAARRGGPKGKRRPPHRGSATTNKAIGTAQPWPDLRSMGKPPIRRGGFTVRRGYAGRGVAGCPRSKGSGEPRVGASAGEGVPLPVPDRKSVAKGKGVTERI